MKGIATLFAAFVAAAVGGMTTIESLLDEMTDRDAAALWPEPSYKGRLWSSFDRRSTAPKSPDWFANSDSSWFLRTETKDGRTERVMVDAEGPGAIVRFWATLGDKPGAEEGILRFYIDGNPEPAIEGPTTAILSGGALCGPPLSDSLPRSGNRVRRGHNLYLPIPYAKSCKVTLERAAEAGRYYYNVETRSYPDGTAVESFSKEALARAKDAVERANALLSKGVDDGLPPGTEEKRADGELPAKSARSISFDGPGAVRRLAIGYEADMWLDMLAEAGDIRIEMEFDGVRTVDADLARFFAAGDAPKTFSTRNTSAVCEGSRVSFVSRWTMPYAKSARLTVRNDTSRPFRMDVFRASAGPLAWNPARSMHFCAVQTDYKGVRTRDSSGSHRDLNYLSVEGASGVCAGCAVSVLNSRRAWWGEGDEKIYVDGEPFPSYLGTGTEDHYGYAWCRPEAFSHPFLAQPDGSGNLAPGAAVNIRLRALDAIPFAKSLRYDMELWHWRDCRIDYVATAWFYRREGGK